jgi:excisionase family DNA binding protein
MEESKQTEILADLTRRLADNIERARQPLPRVAYSLAEVATMVGVSKRVIESQINARALRAKRVGRCLMVTHRDLERWLNG